MARLSIGEAWAMSARTFRSDGQLMLPVTLVLVGLPGMIFSLLVPREQIEAVLRSGQFAPWMLFIVPVLLIGMLNSLAIAAMVLVPRISVSEALRLAGRRLPVLIGALGLFAAAGIAAGVVASLCMVLSPVVGALLILAAALVMLFAGVKLILLPPVVVGRRVGPLEALRRAWRLTAGSFWRLLGFLVIVLLVNLVLDIAIATAGSAVALLVGHVAGSPGLAAFLGALMAAVATSVIGLLIVVMTANIYRQLAEGGSDPAARA